MGTWIRLLFLVCVAAAMVAVADAPPSPLETPPHESIAALPDSEVEQIRRVVDRVGPALVRISVVETDYSDGREQKSRGFGSGVVIREDGAIVTNHHVAGRARHLRVTFWNREEYDAELVGSDPLSDIAVIRIITPPDTAPRSFPVAPFGDSDAIRTGDRVLAMGSPLALSQSVTAGIVSNPRMTLPFFMAGRLRQEGEDPGELVVWIGHDAEIFPGNSGGALVNLAGEVIGINEIQLGLGGAIPSSLVRQVAEALLKDGSVTRAWLGLDIQERLKSDPDTTGALVAGVISGGPADQAGFRPGDLLLSLDGQPVDIQFDVQIPEFKRHEAALTPGKPVKAVVRREGNALTLEVTPTIREPYEPREKELTAWGITGRDLSFLKAREMNRDTTDGVLVTSTRTGGPAAEAKPGLQPDDVIVAVGDTPIPNIEALRQATNTLLENATENRVPVLVTFERRNERLVTVVSLGKPSIVAPAAEARKPWLAVDTQVITREIARMLGNPDLRGFRITNVLKGGPGDRAGLKTGDLIVAVDEMPLTASRQEEAEELAVLIRQYAPDVSVSLRILRDGEARVIPVTLEPAPPSEREMKRFRDDALELVVRDMAFRDRATRKLEDQFTGVVTEMVTSGGWADLGGLRAGDLIMEIDGVAINNVSDYETRVAAAKTAQNPRMVLKIRRGVRTRFVEIEPKWEESHQETRNHASRTP